MTRGFDHPHYVMPVDHPGSFQTGLFGWKPPLSDAQTAEIAGSKQIIYDGFGAALADGAPVQKAAILVDEQFGAALLRDAKAKGITTACPAEKSGQEEFEFQYGEDFAKHIAAFQPTFCKVLVRYNPEGDQAMNARQAARLRRLSEYLRKESSSRFLFELLVPPEKASEPTQMYLTAFHYMFSSPGLALAFTGAFVIVSQLKINVTNAYAGSIAWSNFFSRLTHSHPGRVVWLVFNVAIALMLMELGIFKMLERALGLYSIVAVAWVSLAQFNFVLCVNRSFDPHR